MTEVKIDTDYITLGQMLKLADVIQSGGMIKWFLSEHEVFVNDEPEDRRGRKLRDGDVISINGIGRFQIVS
ncbi:MULTISPECIES: S4 domain-containing protein YaaA [Bacillus]|uniref:S4 domain-containing protein YaaA n=1 Tax=Bacillus TaxID=1386 RepID=UPI000BB8AB41|nr:MULTISPECIES: S4 domain-containing protein YaaA [Bacillus]